MASLVKHLTEKENSLKIIREYIQKIGGQVTQPTLDLISLYNLCEIPETPTMVRLKRLDYWKKAQEVLTPELHEEIYQSATQPDETEKLLEEIQLVIIDDWMHPKLFLPLINICTRPAEVRALYKGLVKIISIDCSMKFDIFLSIVATILQDVGRNQDYLEAKNI